MPRNPLDPYAFDVEPHPFIIHGRATHREEHLGVHTASDYGRAVLYAVQRAMVGGTVGVVLHLDVDGLEPKPDRDAMMQASRDMSYLFDEVDGLAEAVDEGDTDLVEELLEGLRDEFEEGEMWSASTWTEGVYHVLDEYEGHKILSALLDMSGDDLLSTLQSLRTKKAFPARVWMAVIGQQRYMVPIGADRLVQVDMVRPIRNELWTWEEMDELGDEYPSDDPDQPQVFSETMFFNEEWTPDVYVAWKAPKGHHGRIEYHGTDTTRVVKAFPELAKLLVNPWPYTQGAVEEKPSIFSVPQEYVEAMESARPGVGIYPWSRSTGRLLLGERSWSVQDAGQWAGFGGSINVGEDRQQGALRELFEETGYDGPVSGLVEFAPGLYVAVLEDEYEPRLNWETEQAGWLTLEEAAELSPRHWGLDVLLRNVHEGPLSFLVE